MAVNGENCANDTETLLDNPVVFLDLKFGAAKVISAGRVVIELYKDRVPKTVENFRALCTGEKGIGKHGKPLHFKNTSFHRVVPVCMVQGGDLTKMNGTGGESIYGDKFDDENFNVSHNIAGIIGMSNNGPNTNNSQFYITTVPCSHLDDINVAFGIVRKGFNILVDMASIPRENDRPLEPIVIEDCGELLPGGLWCIEERDGTEDIYPPWPNDWDLNPQDDENTIENAIKKIKNSGNSFFKNDNFIDSERKYKKALRYIDWFLRLKDMRPRQIVNDLRISSTLNLALVKLKRRHYRDAVNLCNEVIEKDSSNGKAYYRRGQARLALKDYDKAITDLLTASKLHPSDSNVQAVLNTARKKKLHYLKREKQFFANCFK